MEMPSRDGMARVQTRCGLWPQEAEDQIGPPPRADTAAGVDLQVVLAGIVQVALVIALEVLLPVGVLAPDLGGGRWGAARRSAGPPAGPGRRTAR